MDYSLFGDVLPFDATYRKIIYNTPLVIIYFAVNHHNQIVIYGSAIVRDKKE